MKKIITIFLISLSTLLQAAIGVTSPTAGVANTANATSYALGAFTPSANSLLVVVVYATGTVGTATTMTGGSLTWALESTHILGASEFVIFWARVGGSPASTIPTWDCTGDAATGSILTIFQFTGYDAVTANPIRQKFVSTSATTSTNATITFASALNTGNGYMAQWVNSLGSNVSAPPSGWTEADDISYLTPNTNAANAFRAGGETTAGPFTFTNISTGWVIMGLEIYESGAGPSAYKKGQGHYIF